MTYCIDWQGSRHDSPLHGTRPTAPDPRHPTSAATLTVPGVAAWPRLTLGQCDEMGATTSDSVVAVSTIDTACIIGASRQTTTVFVASRSGRSPFGESWQSITSHWKGAGEVEIRRLSGGVMAEMSSRVIDAAFRPATDKVVVVVGESTQKVREIVDGITAN